MNILHYLKGKITKKQYAISILKKLQKGSKLVCFLKIRFIFVPVIKAFFVYCKVVKEKNITRF